MGSRRFPPRFFLGRTVPQEKAELFEEAIRSRLMLEEQMILTGECDETGTGDAGGQLASGFEGSSEVAPHVHDKRRRLHFGQKVGDVEIADDVEIPGRALSRGRSQL